jgi:hypothetical protein
MSISVIHKKDRGGEDELRHVTCDLFPCGSIRGSLLPSWHNLTAITIKPLVVLTKKASHDRNHLPRRKLTQTASAVRRADTECEICGGGVVPGHNAARGRHKALCLAQRCHSTDSWGMVEQ